MEMPSLENRRRCCPLSLLAVEDDDEETSGMTRLDGCMAVIRKRDGQDLLLLN
jgi:hypothetical protein